MSKTLRNTREDFQKTKRNVDNRWIILEAADFTCEYCGRRSSEAELLVVPTAMAVDHVFPLAKGGRNGAPNLVVACRECNTGKGARELNPATWIGKRFAHLPAMYEEEDRMAKIVADATREDALANYGLRLFRQYYSQAFHSYMRIEDHKQLILHLIRKYGFDIFFDSFRESYIPGNSYKTLQFLPRVCARKSHEQCVASFNAWEAAREQRRIEKDDCVLYSEKWRERERRKNGSSGG